VSGEAQDIPWTSPCDTGTCIQTRTVGGQVEIRDSENPNATLLVPAQAWERFLAAVVADR
jgi:hypothetical protein